MTDKPTDEATTAIDFRDATALVTGAACGIGKALAQALAARGAKLVLADNNADALNNVAAELGAHPTVVDLADPKQTQALIERAHAINGRLDLVCSNAGIGRNKRIKNEDFDAEFPPLFEINFLAGLRLAQAYVRLLEQTGARGRVMFTGSENSLSVPAGVRGAGLGLYAASKHALLIAIEWLRDELKDAPIDLHVLMPGAVYTPLVARKLPDPTQAPPELGLITPERCAALALRGMDLGLFYVPTHAHIIDDMGPRMQGVAASLKALGLRS